MQFNEDHTPLWEAARQLKVAHHLRPVDCPLTELLGILLEINVRPPFSLRCTTIRSQRFTTPVEWEDQAESACSAAIPAANVDVHCRRDLPSPDTYVARAQGPRKRTTRASVDHLAFAHRRTLLHSGTQSGQRQRPSASSSSSRTISNAGSTGTGTGAARPQIHQLTITTTTPTSGSGADARTGFTICSAHRHADAPPARARRARWRAQLVVAVGAVRTGAARLGRAHVSFCRL